MPNKHEFTNAIKLNRNNIIKLKAMKMLIDTNNASTMSVCGISFDLINSNHLIPCIDLEIKRLEEFIEECESSLKELQELSAKISND